MKYEKQDITTVEAPAMIAHGVNCKRKMGSGVAKALYTKWPRVKEEYLAFGAMKLGAVQTICVAPDLYVANCFTQVGFGYNGKPYASTEAIKASLGRVCELIIRSPFLPNEVHIPRIGCGLGGLDWKDVEPIILELEEKHSVSFVVCDNEGL